MTLGVHTHARLSHLLPLALPLLSAPSGSWASGFVAARPLTVDGSLRVPELEFSGPPAGAQVSQPKVFAGPLMALSELAACHLSVHLSLSMLAPPGRTQS